MAGKKQINSDALAGCIQSIRQSAEQALTQGNADEFERVEHQLNQLDSSVREIKQGLWSQEIKAALKRLENDQPLTEADQRAVRAFLVADAEQYLAHENNFSDWVQELRRLLDDLAQRVSNVDRESVGELGGVLKDACRLAPDIRNYLDEQRRVQLFDQSLGQLTSQSRATLIQLLKQQIESPDV